MKNDSFRDLHPCGAPGCEKRFPVWCELWARDITVSTLGTAGEGREHEKKGLSVAHPTVKPPEFGFREIQKLEVGLFHTIFGLVLIFAVQSIRRMPGSF